MSRSRRHFPARGLCADSNKVWKRFAARRVRHLNKQRVCFGLLPLSTKELDHWWNFAKDGMYHFDPDEFPEFMRK